MKITAPLAVTLSAALALSACVPADPYATGGAAPAGARTQQGAVTGAVLGGLVGAASGGEDGRFGRAIAGAALGAIAGGAIGYNLDQQEAELRGQLGSRVQIVNTGTELRVVMPQDILFATDSTVLQPTLVQDLRYVADSLMRYPQSQVQVIGHTDSTGSDSYNADLSQRRANVVANVLRDYGVPFGRVVAIGRGEAQPVASNATEAGRAQNRRVEIIIRPDQLR